METLFVIVARLTVRAKGGSWEEETLGNARVELQWPREGGGGPPRLAALYWIYTLALAVLCGLGWTWGRAFVSAGGEMARGRRPAQGRENGK